MTDLRNIYRQALPGRIATLEAARQEKGEEATEAIRRIAHSLRGSGGTYGYPEISEAAALVEDAASDGIDKRLDHLIALLRSVVETEPPAHVLAIEDEPEHGLLIRSALQSPGRRITVATTADEARRTLAAGDVSLILLDLMLPDRDGRALLLEFRERPATAATPIIVLSAKNDAKAKAECFSLGATGYLEKPVDPALLQAVVGAQLRRPGPVAPEPARREAAEGRPCVLVMEDDQLVASVLRHRLERDGFDIHHSPDGMTALEAIEKQHIALAILDVKVPGMDGFDVLARLRAHPRTADIPVIMLTSLGGEKDVLRAFQLGASDYITKPFSPVEVLARVKRLIGR